MTSRSDLGHRQVKKLLAYMEQGSLPTAYDGVGDWLYDFWPDLSWGPRSAFRGDIQAILEHPEFSGIAEFFRETYAFDFEGMLRGALEWDGEDTDDLKPFKTYFLD